MSMRRAVVRAAGRVLEEAVKDALKAGATEVAVRAAQRLTRRWDEQPAPTPKGNDE